MVASNLIGCRVQKASIESNVNSTQQLTLEYSFSFRMRTQGDSSLGVLGLTVASHDQEALRIHVDLEGTFYVNGVHTEDDRKALHDLCFETLFPVAVKQVTVLGRMAGLKNIQVPKPDTSKQKINIAKLQKA